MRVKTQRPGSLGRAAEQVSITIKIKTRRHGLKQLPLHKATPRIIPRVMQTSDAVWNRSTASEVFAMVSKKRSPEKNE